MSANRTHASDGADIRSAGASPYRPEIDGLRAIAVAATMLYHAEIPGFASGYLGVDIFFAISGFLITGIIVSSAEAGRFSLLDFYMRRIRRIIPALAMVCLLTVPFAVLLMIPDDLENYGQSLVATALSGNNVLLFLTSGYFELETHFKPLFHTWSLGVEEQYYVLVPLLLALACRWGGRRTACAVLATCTALSFGICEYVRAINFDANFLLLPSRFWELGLGGLTFFARPAMLAAIGTHARGRQALVAVALAMVLSSLFLLGSIYNLPGWQSLLPLTGTCILLALANHNGAGQLLSARPMTAIGLISYSAYLYHVPLMAFLNIVSLDAPALAQRAATIPLALLLAWLSWRSIEKPFRDPRRTSNRVVLLFSAISLAITVSIGLVLHATSGFFANTGLAKHDPQLGYLLTAKYNDEPFALEGRPFPDTAKSRHVLIIGNSFARDFINMGLETGRFAGLDISYAYVQHCDAWPAELIDRIRNSAAVILGSGVRISEIPCTQREIARLEALGTDHIAVLGMKDFGYNNNAIMLLPPAQRYAYRAKPQAFATAANAAARRALPGRYYVDLFRMLDDGTGTVPVFTPQRRFISQDRHHLTRAGAHYVGEKVFAQPAFAWLPPKLTQ